ncbi:MAG: response regulator transcription factor [Planctomycetota bacterium]
MNKKIRVLLVEDHSVMRLGLRAAFEGTEVEVVGEAISSQEALEKSNEIQCDVVLLDVRLGEENGLGTLARLKLEHPETPVIIYSAHDNPTYVARALALEAASFVLKSEPVSRLIEVLKLAHAGEQAWQKSDLRRVTGALATPRVGGDIDVPLTHREGEVLHQITAGLTNKEIGKTLGISAETVKEHVQHILRKIGVTDRTQAAVWAVRKGLV